MKEIIKDLNEFVSIFTDERLDAVQIRKKSFLAGKELVDLMEKIKQKEGLDPESIGIFLGEVVRKEFKPSLALLDLIAKSSDRKVFVDEKAEWLFLCGKDIFKSSVIKRNAKAGLVLVQNKNDENLGYGKLVRRGDVFVKNILDRGDFLRRERRKK
jgi:60S ribosome subunit biogenesis protein NIP7